MLNKNDLKTKKKIILMALCLAVPSFAVLGIRAAQNPDAGFINFVSGNNIGYPEEVVVPKDEYADGTVEEALLVPEEELSDEEIYKKVSEKLDDSKLAEEMLALVKKKYKNAYLYDSETIAYTDDKGKVCYVSIYDPDAYIMFSASTNKNTSATPSRDFEDEYKANYKPGSRKVAGYTSSTRNTRSPFNNKVYYHSKEKENATVLNGIDVSQWQGVIDWKKAKAGGVDFAIIRIGYRGYGAEGNIPDAGDKYAKTNIIAATQAGVEVGVYFYSQAITKNEGIQEAKWCINYLNNNSLGKYVTLPVVIDYEYYATGKGRLYNAGLSAAQHQTICDAFASTVDEAGYTAGVYANYSMLMNDMQPTKSPETTSYWVARWNNETFYPNSYDFWQYTDAGTVPGINGNVDCDFWYQIPDIILSDKPEFEASFGDTLGDVLGSVQEQLKEDGYTDISEDTCFVNEYGYYVFDDSLDTKVGYPGENKFKLTFVPNSTYKGRIKKLKNTATIKVSFIYDGTDENLEIELSSGRFTYDGGVMEPKALLKYKSEALREGKDYSLSYTNNVNAANSTDFDAPAVVIEGVGEYVSVNVIKNFTIEPLEVTVKAKDVLSRISEELPAEYEYEVAGLINSDVLIKEPEFTVNVSDINAEGEYVITPFGADAGSNYRFKYEAGVLHRTAMGAPCKIEYVTGGIGSVEYDNYVECGTYLNEPSVVNNDEINYSFGGFYKDRKYTKKWNFNKDVVAGDTIIYIKWVRTAANVYPVSLLEDGELCPDFTVKYAATLNTNDKKDQKLISSIKYGKTTLKKDTDYQVMLSATEKSYDADGKQLPSGTQVATDCIPKGYRGQYVMTVTGTGKYCDSAEFDVSVAEKALNISNATITLGKDLKNVIYTGKPAAFTPAYYDKASRKYFGIVSGNVIDKVVDKNKVYTVTLSGKNLVCGRDFTVESTGDAASGKQTFTIVGKNNYYGRKSVTYTVKNCKLSNSELNKEFLITSGSGNLDAKFENEPVLHNDLRFVYRGMPLVFGRDYTISYRNNNKPGNAQMIITGLPTGGYTGKITIKYKILK